MIPWFSIAENSEMSFDTENSAWRLSRRGFLSYVPDRAPSGAVQTRGPRLKMISSQEQPGMKRSNSKKESFSLSPHTTHGGFSCVLENAPSHTIRGAGMPPIVWSFVFLVPSYI